MRRRIYIDPEGDLSDQTDSPYLYRLDQPPDEALWICRTGALYDDALWAEYEAACKGTHRLRGLVCRALVNEPWDDVERDLAERYTALADVLDYDDDETYAIADAEMKRLAARAVEHAQGRAKP
jgi:hypothetical protein